MMDTYEHLKAQKDRILENQNRELVTAKRLLRQAHDDYDSTGRIGISTKKQMDAFWDEFGVK